MNKYKNFSVEDFLQDEFFNQWVMYRSPNDSELWERWLENNPEMQEVVDEAKTMILAFNYLPDTISEEFYTNLKERIDLTIKTDSLDQHRRKIVPLWLKMAAAFIGAALLAGFFYYSLGNQGFVTISSKYAETKNVVLPDGSEVVLNANSVLKYSRTWNEKDREVWLSGEAFFKVKHVEGLEKVPVRFVVHTSKLDVEVLGTQFNINSNNGNQTEVLLTSGRVKLSHIDGNKGEINIYPNDLFLYNDKSKRYNVNRVIPDNYISWIDHKYIFEKTSLEDVCKELQRYYGKTVTIQDEKMREQRLSGTFELQNEQSLVQTLSALLGVKVDQQDNQVIIYPK